MVRPNVVIAHGKYRVDATRVQGMEGSHTAGDSRTSLPRSKPSSRVLEDEKEAVSWV